jgi:hypothetical protein
LQLTYANLNRYNARAKLKTKYSRAFRSTNSVRGGHERKTSAHACISEHFLRVQESFSVKKNARNLQVYTKPFVGILLWDKDIVLMKTL